MIRDFDSDRRRITPGLYPKVPGTPVDPETLPMYEKKRLPAGPMQSLVLSCAATHSERATLLDVDESRIRRFLTQSEIQLDTADRWCTRLGKHLSDVYPHH